MEDDNGCSNTGCDGWDLPGTIFSVFKELSCAEPRSNNVETYRSELEIEPIDPFLR